MWSGRNLPAGDTGTGHVANRPALANDVEASTQRGCDYSGTSVEKSEMLGLNDEACQLVSTMEDDRMTLGEGKTVPHTATNSQEPRLIKEWMKAVLAREILTLLQHCDNLGVFHSGFTMKRIGN